MAVHIVDPDWTHPQWGWVHIFGYISVWTFVAFKPVIYVLTNDYFRQAFFDSFPCFKPNGFNVTAIEFTSEHRQISL